MNIFEALREDHDKQRTLVDLLCKTKGDSRGRAEIFENLKTALDQHAVGEEEFFYRPLLNGELAHEKARHGIAEHKELDDLIEELEATDFDSPGWLPKAKKLRERVLHHLDEEEHEVFQLAGKELSEEQKKELAVGYRAHMDGKNAR